MSYVNQIAHFSAAGFIVSELGRLGPNVADAAVLGMLGFAAVKEFLYDAHTGQSFQGQCIDFIFYAFGATLAGILAHLGMA